MDYEELEPAPVLFLSDSIKYRLGTVRAFSKPEVQLLKESYPEKFVMAASVKCPSVKEADMSPNNMNACRQHLDATIDKVKPKLIFACGNLAMKMLIKKSGITNKRSLFTTRTPVLRSLAIYNSSKRISQMHMKNMYLRGELKEPSLTKSLWRSTRSTI
jgi:uracil-DNA glycosylase family 4